MNAEVILGLPSSPSRLGDLRAMWDEAHEVLGRVSLLQMAYALCTPREKGIPLCLGHSRVRYFTHDDNHVCKSPDVIETPVLVTWLLS